MNNDEKKENDGKALVVIPTRPVPKTSSRQARHLAQSVLLEESGTSGLVRFTMLIASATTAGFIIWAGFTDVPEIAIADGQAIPSGQIRSLQHLEGGVVEEVLVSENETVEAGRPILRLAAAQASSDLEQTRAREAALIMKAERLKAFFERRTMNVEAMPKGHRELLADNLAILESQNRAKASAAAVILSQIQQKKAEAQTLKSQTNSLREQEKPLREEAEMRRELAEKGLIARSIMLDTVREAARIQGEIERLSGQEITATAALAEAESRLADLDAAGGKTVMDEYGSTIGELAQIRESLGRHEDRTKRLEIVSPVRGIVKGLAPKNPGAVIQPGGQVCDVVPIGEETRVEARVSPKDVGHLARGQKVKVKITTYDFARYGAVEGKLIAISPSSFIDEKNAPYFKATISLASDHVGNDSTRRILPGMTASSEIVTGSKTLLQYMLKPVFTQIQQSFRER
jgi:HlyD family secretion protein/adhesin transport system membrane fusion protein